MGNSASAPRGQSNGGKFSTKDLERLQRRFMRMADQQGMVHISQFQEMVELGANPFTGRILQLFDSDNDGRLSVSEFTKAMEHFGALGSPDQQYEFAFRIYDLDGDGLISGPELQTTLSMLMGNAYTPAQLEQVVLHTLRQFDLDGDQALNLQEFKQLVNATDLQSKLAMRV